MQVDKYVATGKEKKSLGEMPFPLMVTPGLKPLDKVWTNYDQKKNIFNVQINGEDYYSLPFEALDYDPSKTEILDCELEINSIVRELFGKSRIGETQYAECEKGHLRVMK